MQENTGNNRRRSNDIRRSGSHEDRRGIKREWGDGYRSHHLSEDVNNFSHLKRRRMHQDNLGPSSGALNSAAGIPENVNNNRHRQPSSYSHPNDMYMKPYYNRNHENVPRYHYHDSYRGTRPDYRHHHHHHHYPQYPPPNSNVPYSYSRPPPPPPQGGTGAPPPPPPHHSHHHQPPHHYPLHSRNRYNNYKIYNNNGYEKGTYRKDNWSRRSNRGTPLTPVSTGSNNSNKIPSPPSSPSSTASSTTATKDMHLPSDDAPIEHQYNSPLIGEHGRQSYSFDSTNSKNQDMDQNTPTTKRQLTLSSFDKKRKGLQEDEDDDDDDEDEDENVDEEDVDEDADDDDDANVDEDEEYNRGEEHEDAGEEEEEEEEEDEENDATENEGANEDGHDRGKKKLSKQASSPKSTLRDDNKNNLHTSKVKPSSVEKDEQSELPSKEELLANIERIDSEITKVENIIKKEESSDENINSVLIVHSPKKNQKLAESDSNDTSSSSLNKEHDNLREEDHSDILVDGTNNDQDVEELTEYRGNRLENELQIKVNNKIEEIYLQNREKSRFACKTFDFLVHEDLQTDSDDNHDNIDDQITESIRRLQNMEKFLESRKGVLNFEDLYKCFMSEHEKIRNDMEEEIKKRVEKEEAQNKANTQDYRRNLRLWKESLSKKQTSALRYQNAEESPTTLMQNNFGTSIYVSQQMQDPDFHKRHLKTLAKIPPMLSEHERQYRIENNNLRIEDPLRDYNEHRAMERAWTLEERKRFMELFSSYPKDLKKIARLMPSKTSGDIVTFYYNNKKSTEFKKLMKELKQKRRYKRRIYDEGGSTRPTARQQRYADPDYLSNQSLNGSAPGSRELKALVDSNNNSFDQLQSNDSYLRPRASRNGNRDGNSSQNTVDIPQFEGNSNSLSQNQPWSDDWNSEDIKLFSELLMNHGRNFTFIAKNLRSLSQTHPPKTAAQCKQFFLDNKHRLGLDKLIPKRRKKGSNRKTDGEQQDDLLLQQQQQQQQQLQHLRQHLNQQQFPPNQGEYHETRLEMAKPRRVPRRVIVWTKSERDAFLRYLEQFGRNWKKISEQMKTKTEKQIKSFYEDVKIKVGVETETSIQRRKKRQKAKAVKSSSIANMSTIDELLCPDFLNEFASIAKEVSERGDGGIEEIRSNLLISSDSNTPDTITDIEALPVAPPPPPRHRISLYCKSSHEITNSRPQLKLTSISKYLNNGRNTQNETDGHSNNMDCEEEIFGNTVDSSRSILAHTHELANLELLGSLALENEPNISLSSSSNRAKKQYHQSQTSTGSGGSSPATNSGKSSPSKQYQIQQQPGGKKDINAKGKFFAGSTFVPPPNFYPLATQQLIISSLSRIPPGLPPTPGNTNKQNQQNRSSNSTRNSTPPISATTTTTSTSTSLTSGSGNKFKEDNNNVWLNNFTSSIPPTKSATGNAPINLFNVSPPLAPQQRLNSIPPLSEFNFPSNEKYGSSSTKATIDLMSNETISRATPSPPPPIFASSLNIANSTFPSKSSANQGTEQQHVNHSSLPPFSEISNAISQLGFPSRSTSDSSSTSSTSSTILGKNTFPFGHQNSSQIIGTNSSIGSVDLGKKRISFEALEEGKVITARDSPKPDHSNSPSPSIPSLTSQMQPMVSFPSTINSSNPNTINNFNISTSIPNTPNVQIAKTSTSASTTTSTTTTTSPISNTTTTTSSNKQPSSSSTTTTTTNMITTNSLLTHSGGNQNQASNFRDTGKGNPVSGASGGGGKTSENEKN